MASNSKIEWTETTWNPVTGCTKISDGCKNCYAERMSKRLKAMGVVRYQNGFDLTIHEDMLSLPFQWKQPKKVFVNSMSDLFHEQVPDEFIRKVFFTMENCPHHTFQILTKRSRRLLEFTKNITIPINIWLGVTVENEKVTDRIDDLRSTSATVRFISFEPLIGQIGNVDLDGIHWAIVGGESGPFSRPMESCWVESIYKQCKNQNVPFFFKQWGGTRKHKTGRLLHERTYSEMPIMSNDLAVIY